jgi:hypothetical protein
MDKEVIWNKHADIFQEFWAKFKYHASALCYGGFKLCPRWRVNEDFYENIASFLLNPRIYVLQMLIIYLVELLTLK